MQYSRGSFAKRVLCACWYCEAFALHTAVASSFSLVIVLQGPAHVFGSGWPVESGISTLRSPLGGSCCLRHCVTFLCVRVQCSTLWICLISFSLALFNWDWAWTKCGQFFKSLASASEVGCVSLSSMCFACSSHSVFLAALILRIASVIFICTVLSCGVSPDCLLLPTCISYNFILWLPSLCAGC